MYFLSGGEVCLGWKDCFAPLAMTQDDRRPDDQTTKVVTTNARNDNLMCAIKVHSKCHCEGLFRSNLPTFTRELVAALLRYAIVSNLPAMRLIVSLTV